MKNIKNDRIYYIDILRVIACMAVVMIHTSARYVVNDFGSLNFWIGNILDSLSRIGVPLFAMISGALMLDENYRYSANKNKKHIFKMIKFFIFWSCIYCIFFQIFIPIFISHEQLHIGNIISGLLNGYYHLWFVYMIVGFYLLLPLLRLWVNNKNIIWVKYFIVLAFIFNFLFPQIVEIGSYYSELFTNIKYILENVNMKYVGGYTTYFILGWYLRFVNIRERKTIYVLGILSIVVEIVMTYVLSERFNEAIQMYDNLSVNVLLQTMMIFVFVKLHVKKDNCQNPAVISWISKYSLGIYAMHAGIVTVVYIILERIGIDIAYITVPIVYICAFGGAFIISFVLGKIKWLKQLVI